MFWVVLCLDNSCCCSMLPLLLPFNLSLNYVHSCTGRVASRIGARLGGDHTCRNDERNSTYVPADGIEYICPTSISSLPRNRLDRMLCYVQRSEVVSMLYACSTTRDAATVQQFRERDPPKISLIFERPPKNVLF